MIDTLALANRLEQAGAEHEHAEAMATPLRRACPAATWRRRRI